MRACGSETAIAPRSSTQAATVKRNNNHRERGSMHSKRREGQTGAVSKPCRDDTATTGVCARAQAPRSGDGNAREERCDRGTLMVPSRIGHLRRAEKQLGHGATATRRRLGITRPAQTTALRGSARDRAVAKTKGVGGGGADRSAASSDNRAAGPSPCQGRRRRRRSHHRLSFSAEGTSPMLGGQRAPRFVGTRPPGSPPIPAAAVKGPAEVVAVQWPLMLLRGVGQRLSLRRLSCPLCCPIPARWFRDGLSH